MSVIYNELIIFYIDSPWLKKHKKQATLSIIIWSIMKQNMWHSAGIQPIFITQVHV